jgi:hypothetical protein
MVSATAIDLTQWNDDELRADVKRCMNALAQLTDGSPAQDGLTAVIAGSVAELTRRTPASTGTTPPTICRCGEAFLTADDATIHLTAVFTPPGNVGTDGRIHEEITIPGRQPATPAATGETGHDSGPDGVQT